MTSLKTKNICFLTAFLFLAIVPTLAEVVKSVSECKGYEPTPPHIPGILEKGKILNQNRYKIICQTYDDVQRYLTVYDIENRIPVFSAYEYKGSVRGRCGVTWMIEPQLEDNIEPPKRKRLHKELEDREHEDNIEPPKRKRLHRELDEDPTPDDNMKTGGRGNYEKQAVNRDYDKNTEGYDKGHLFPANHASTYEEQISTFTLTNAVPQFESFNRGKWSQMEQKFRDTMKKHITDKIRCFVVVGAKPSDKKYLKNTPLKKVNIPEAMWSAFYCTNHMSGAFWGINEDDGDVGEGTLEDFKNKHDWAKNIVVFP